MGLEFRVLGPVEAWADGQRLQLGSVKHRTTLAVLLLHAGRVVSVPRLVGLLWGDDPPAAAVSKIRTIVWQLRRLLAGDRPGAGHELIVQSSGGYQLVPGAWRLDLAEFEAGVAEAQRLQARGAVGVAAALLGRMLDLWRGPAVCDVTGLLAGEVAPRLEELRLTAVERRIDADLALHRHGELVAELRALVVEHPAREHLRALLMLALSRCGQRAAALEAYRDAQRWLADELGLDPGVELRGLHTAILRGEEPAAAADPVAVVPAQLPPDVAGFTGRVDELSALDALLAGLASGALPVAVLTGPPGAGKSALAVHWGHANAGRFPDGQLFVDLQGYHERSPLAASEVLGRFLRALGVPGDQVPADEDERCGLYRSMVNGRRVLIVLDNARSAAQVAPLLPGTPSCRILVTSRDQLTSVPGGRLVTLGHLDAVTALTLLGRIVGAERLHADLSAARRITELAGRLPLALRVAGARLSAKPHWSVRDLALRLDDERRRLDELVHDDLAVRASLAMSYQALDPAARCLFRRAGLLDAPDFAPWICAALVESSVADAVRLIEHLVDVHLLEAVGQDPAGQPRYRFHDLTRLFARERCKLEEPSASRHHALRRAFGSLLMLAEGAARSFGLDRPLLHGTTSRIPLADPPGAVTRSPIDWLEAERLVLLAAFVQADELQLDELSWELATQATALYEAHQYVDDWRTSHEQALHTCRSAGNRRGEAALLLGLGRWSFASKGGGDRGYLASALAIFTTLGDRMGRAVTLSEAADRDRLAGQVHDALKGFQAAQRIFAEIGELIGEARTLRKLGMAHLDVKHIALAKDCLERAVEICGGLGLEAAREMAYYWLGHVHLAQGRLSTATEVFSETLRHSLDRGDVIGEVLGRLGLGDALMRQGQMVEAEDSLIKALGMVRRYDHGTVEGRVLRSLGELCTGDGRLDEAVDYLRQSVARFDGMTNRVHQIQSLRSLCEAYRTTGDHAAAGRTVTDALRLSRHLDLPTTSDLEQLLVTVMSGPGSQAG